MMCDARCVCFVRCVFVDVKRWARACGYWLPQCLQCTRRVFFGAVLLDGIFFDEMTNDCNYDTYYANLTAYVKSKDAGALVIGNPGTASVTCPGGSTGSEVTWAASVRFNCCLRGKRGWLVLGNTQVLDFLL